MVSGRWRRLVDRVAPPLDPGDAAMRIREAEALAERIAAEFRAVHARLDALERERGDTP